MKNWLPLFFVLTALLGWAGAESVDQEVVTVPRGDRDPGKATQIYANEEATYDSENRTAVFTGDVRVEDPRFTLTSRKLTVHMSDSEEGGMERAVAEGDVVIVQKKEGSSRDVSRGFAERAIYHAATGEVELVGWPRVQQGFNVHIATEAATRMRLTEDGRLITDGQSRTEIQDRND